MSRTEIQHLVNKCTKSTRGEIIQSDYLTNQCLGQDFGFLDPDPQKYADPTDPDARGKISTKNCKK